MSDQASIVDHLRLIDISTWSTPRDFLKWEEDTYIDSAFNWFINDRVTRQRTTHVNRILQQLLETVSKLTVDCGCNEGNEKSKCGMGKDLQTICLDIKENQDKNMLKYGSGSYVNILKMCTSLFTLITIHSWTSEMDEKVFEKDMKKGRQSLCIYTVMSHLKNLLTQIKRMLKERVKKVDSNYFAMRYKGMERPPNYTFNDMFGNFDTLLNDAGKAAYSDWHDNWQHVFNVMLELGILIFPYIQNRNNVIKDRANFKKMKTMFATEKAKLPNDLTHIQKIEKIVMLHDLIEKFYAVASAPDEFKEESQGSKFADNLIESIIAPELLKINDLHACYSALLEVQGPASLEERDLMPITDVTAFKEECYQYCLSCDNFKAREDMYRKDGIFFNDTPDDGISGKEGKWSSLANLPLFPPRILDVLERVAKISGKSCKINEEPVCAYCNNIEETTYWDNKSINTTDKPFHILYQNCSCGAICCCECFNYNYGVISFDPFKGVEEPRRSMICDESIPGYTLEAKKMGDSYRFGSNSDDEYDYDDYDFFPTTDNYIAYARDVREACLHKEEQEKQQ